MKKRTAIMLLVVLFLALLGVDQLSKYGARLFLTPYSSLNLIPGMLKLTLLFNTGAAWGVGSGLSFVFVGIALFTFVGIIIYIGKASEVSFGEVCACALLCAGALGNALDRTLFGVVTDFFELSFISFPVFNVADIEICLGIALLFLIAIRKERSARVSKNN